MSVLKYTTLVLTTLFLFTEVRSMPAQGQTMNPGRSWSQFWVYIGTYTGEKSQGIYVTRLNTATGKLTPAELAAETPNPTFLAIGPSVFKAASSNPPALYAANESNNGSVSAFAIDKQSGKLQPLNQQPSKGDGPCHLSVDASGQCLLVANYGSGSIAALPVLKDGRVGEPVTFIQHGSSSAATPQQPRPHAHWIAADPANRFVLACDLGLDKVLIYKLDPSKTSLVANDPPFVDLKPGSGPRHLAFHRNGRYVYVINEISSTMTAFNYDAQQGALSEIQTITTLPESFTGKNTTAELALHPSGRYLYGSNRGHDSIVVYSVDLKTGKLTLVEHQSTKGKTPRNFAIDPTGQWLLAANQGSDSVVVFRIDHATGRLRPTGEVLTVGAPVCLQFVPTK